MPKLFRLLVFAMVASALMLAAGVPYCRADATWDVKLEVSDEVNTEIDEDDALTTETQDMAFEVDYSTELAPTLEFSFSFSFDITEEKIEDEYNTKETTPEAEAELVAQWWSIAAGWSQTIADDEDPSADEDRVDSEWDVEVKIEPENEKLPQFTYGIAGDDDTIDRSYEGAFEYGFLDMVEIGVEAKKDTTDAREALDDDTDDRALSGNVDFSRDFLEFWKFEAGWEGERDQSLTLTDSDLLLEKGDSLSNNIGSKLEYAPLGWMEYSVEHEWDWEKDLVADLPAERTDTLNGEATWNPELTETITIELGYSDERVQTYNTDSNSREWSQEYNTSASLEIFDILTVDGSYDRAVDRDSPEDPTEQFTRTRDDDYKLEAEATIWEDQITASIARELKYSWEMGIKTTSEYSWEYAAEISWDRIPNLELKPKYTVTRDGDAVEGSKDAERALEVELAYTIELGSVVSIELEHGYSRTAFYPDSDAGHIEREDDTSLSVAFSDFLEGMSTEGGVERTVSDQSQDDLGPEMDLKYVYKFEWQILDNYEASFEYEHELNDLSEDGESYNTGFSCELYNDQIKLSFEHEKTIQLGGDKKKSHSYLVELSGEF